MLGIVILRVFMVLLPEGGMLRFYLEPARIGFFFFALRKKKEGSLLTQLQVSRHAHEYKLYGFDADHEYWYC